VTDIEQGTEQSDGGRQPVPQQPPTQESGTLPPVAQPPVAHQPLSQQHVEQESRPAAERLVKTFDSWQKVVLALTALLVASGGLAAAGVKVLQTVKGSGTGVAAATRPGPTLSQPSVDQPTDGSGDGKTSGPTPTPSATTPALIGTSSFGIADEASLTYNTASGPQDAFEYFAELDNVVAQNGVNLVVLDPPPPTASAAYAACEDDTDYTSEIVLSSLAPGSTLCAITPGDQVMWITLRPTDPNSQSNALNVTVLQWQGPVQNQSGS
jgi:hypothetical protein